MVAISKHMPHRISLKEKKRVTRMEFKLYVKHEKSGVCYPTEKWVRGTWIWDETFFQFFFIIDIFSNDQ